MASNFPNTLDSFANPLSTNNLDNPSHSGQHTNANDSIIAIETKLGIGNSPAGSATSGQILTAQGGGTAVWATLTSLSNATFFQPLLTSPEESISISASPSSGTVALDFATAGVTFATANATGNWVANLRGGVSTTLNSMITVGQSITHVYINTNGTGVFYPTGYQIDGTAITPSWQAAGTPTTGNANSLDAYSFTVIKTASTPTYTVLASQTRFA
jgi:hypothetical protein